MSDLVNRLLERADIERHGATISSDDPISELLDEAAAAALSAQPVQPVAEEKVREFVRIYNRAIGHTEQLVIMRSIIEATATPALQQHGAGLAWTPWPEDGSKQFEGNNDKRQYISRAMTAWGAYFIMLDGQGRYSFIFRYDDDPSTFETEAQAKAAAQADFNRRILSSLSAPPVALEELDEDDRTPKPEHKKRGGEYTVIGEGRVQCNYSLADLDLVTIYRGDDGQHWVRPTTEFEDGRFEHLANPKDPSPVTEAIGQVRALVQEAKGIAEPRGSGPVTDHLDFAESWLTKLEAALAVRT